MIIYLLVLFKKLPVDDKENAAGPSASSTSNGQEDKDGEKDAKKTKNRCAVCRKKVGLTGNNN